ncbi:MAG: MBL fold metallo-hydrolase [Rhodopseudomonas sp.]|nr:MBL fold metallo-hydrolase [Rhodopseudomonas sp.]
MRIIMLGTGAALPDPDRGHTSILLTLANGRHVLLDCGHGATRQLVRMDVNPADVGTVVFTHLHYDHIADFPYFIISSWMLGRQGAPDVFGPRGTKSFVEPLFEGGAFDADIKARAAYPLRQANIEALRPTVLEYDAGLIFADDDLRITAAPVDHIPPEISPCFGLRIEADGKTVVFSGDTKPCDGIAELAKGADLLIHECTFPEAFIEHRRKSGVGTFAHTSPTELGRLAHDSGVKHLVATHIGHFDSLSPVLKRAAAHHLPVDLMGAHQLDAMAADIRRGYGGTLQIARDLMTIHL